MKSLATLSLTACHVLVALAEAASNTIYLSPESNIVQIQDGIDRVAVTDMGAHEAVPLASPTTMNSSWPGVEGFAQGWTKPPRAGDSQQLLLQTKTCDKP